MIIVEGKHLSFLNYLGRLLSWSALTALVSVELRGASDRLCWPAHHKLTPPPPKQSADNQISGGAALVKLGLTSVSNDEAGRPLLSV